ncbi:MAG: class I SAM-dependent methyltransferase [Candidatus Omnitrophota bacterium]
MRKKKNYLLEQIISIFIKEKKGCVLDLGCGDGDYSVRLKEIGFDVKAADLDLARFKQRGKIDFQECDVTKRLPFADSSFDYVLLAEVIEHLKNPYAVMQEIGRVLKKEGKLVISTPNVLNLKSRVRYLFEGCYEFFREPLLEQSRNPKEVIFNLHVIPWRYHELEYLLEDSGFSVEEISTSTYEGKEWFILVPLMWFQLNSKQKRMKKKKGLDYSRINKILLSPEILFGRHLIITAKKEK